VTTERGPAASGARLLGDDYQHLLTWLYAAQLLRKDPTIVKVELEKHDAGNVDDLVVHRRDSPGEYHQVKFTTKPAGEPLTGEWFTERGRAAKSPLERFYASWVKLTQGAVRPRMVLHTNRQPVAGDPVLACLSGDRALLVPKLGRATQSSEAGKARAAWATQLEVDESELLEMLASLEIRAARESITELKEHCRLAMDAVGLLITSDAIDQGMLAARRWIEEGVREVVAETVSQLVNERSLRAAEPRAGVLIQALAHDPLPELAVVALDWVDAFEGDNPGARRQTTSPEVWNGRFAPELRDAEQRVRAMGYSHVRLTGAFRLTTAVYAGVVFSDTAGYTVAMAGRSGDGGWSDVTSTGDRATVLIEVVETALDGGDEIAIGLSVSADVTDDVLHFIQADGVQVGRFLNFRVADPGRTVLTGPAEIRGWAEAATDALRGLGREAPGVVHAFISVPRPAAMLLGHQWNRMPRVHLWEELSAGRYAPSFTVDAG
jgi:hypothetical protein